MPKNNSSFVNETLPTELRDAMILGKEYAITTFKDQFWSDIETLFMELDEKYNEYMAAFEAYGGIIEKINPRTYKFTVGTTDVTMLFDEVMCPVRVRHDFSVFDDPLTENEICLILNAYIALAYRNTPDRSILMVKLARMNSANNKVVNGLEKKAIKLYDDPRYTIEVLSGANIDKKEVG